MIQLTKSTALPGAAKEAAEEANRLATVATGEASRAELVAAGGNQKAGDEARAKAKQAQAAADEAARTAADRLRPLQAGVVGAQIVGTVQQVADDQSWVVVRTPQPPKRPWPVPWEIGALSSAALAGDGSDKGVLVSIHVPTDLRTLVKSMRPGDGVTAVYQRLGIEGSAATGAAPVTSTNTLKQLEWRKVRATRFVPSLTFLVSALALLGVASAFTKGHPSQLFLGEDNRYSTSKFQTVLWFWVVISTYLAIVVLRWTHAGSDYVGGIDIPMSLLALSGLSVLGVAGAKLITTSKVETGKATTGPVAGSEPKPSADVAKGGDLINDDLNRTDLGDFQLVTVTGIAVVMYALSALEFMTGIELRRSVAMPEVDATLLALFGLSQAGYLGKKLAGDAGAGMTAQQAIERADVLVAAIKASSRKVEGAEKAVVNQKAVVEQATLAISAAATRAAAKPSLATAMAAAEAAAMSDGEASQSLKSMKAQVADLATLAATWSNDPAVKPLTDTSTADARAEQLKAEALAKSATQKAKDARSLVDQAQVVVNAKP